MSSHRRSNYRDCGDKVYSFETCILQRVGELTIGNVTAYSAASWRHQTAAGAYRADVMIGKVPEGCTDLLQLTIERDILEYSHIHGRVLLKLQPGEYRFGHVAQGAMVQS